MKKGISGIMIVLVLLTVIATPLFAAGASDKAPAPGASPLDGYPAKNIHWIVPAAAGAALDLPTRVLADTLNLGKTIVVENIAGGSQTIGTAEAASRAADGYTLLTMANACLFTQPLMMDLTYEVSDFRMIAMLAPYVQGGVVVRADSPIKNVEDWLALLRSGKRYSYGITNAGGFGHMSIASTMNQLGHSNDPNGVMVVYNGSANNIAALMSGEPDFIIADAPDVVSQIASGELRMIVVLHDEICELFPDAPTISDYGVKDMGTFVGMKLVAVRSDVPNEIVEWLKEKVNAGIQEQKYQDYLIKSGFGPIREYSESELDEIVAVAIKDYGEVMKAVGII